MTNGKKRTSAASRKPEKAPGRPEAERKADAKPSAPARKVPAAGKRGAAESAASRPAPAAAPRPPAAERTATAPERKPVQEPVPPAPTTPARLKELYRRDAVPRMRDRFQYRNVMEVPRLEKVVINVRVGDATTDTRFLDKEVEEVTIIAGQRPVIPRAKKSIAAWKLRKGIPIAAKVTLRGRRMYEFVDKLFNIALPRIKDFKGISERQFDGRGNLNVGVREQLIFPEIDYDKVEKIRGMDITLVTTARTDEEAKELLRLLGLPLREAGAPA